MYPLMILNVTRVLYFLKKKSSGFLIYVENYHMVSHMFTNGDMRNSYNYEELKAPRIVDGNGFISGPSYLLCTVVSNMNN